MANLRTGKYAGEYFGSYINESQSLSNSEMKKNALYIYKALKQYGWSNEAIAGLCGNIQAESAFNPGRWQSDNVGNTSAGYGLVQWTPASKYFEWCNSESRSDASEMDNNIDRIIYEVEHNIQYYSTDTYPESFKQFTQSTQSPYYLACAFAWNYERSYVVLYGTEAEKEQLRQKRGGNARYWYEYLVGEEPPVNPDEPDTPNPDEPDAPTTRKKKMPVWMMCSPF